MKNAPENPRLAVLGTGWGTRIQIPAFRAAGWEVTALWARDAEKAERIAAEHEVLFGSSEVTEILARDDVDLVSVVTPPHTHAEWAIAALEAGKHVLCEKPTALDAGEAERMVEAARTHPDQLALIDHELRFDPLRRRMKERVADGFTGEPLHAEGIFRYGGRLAHPDGSFLFPWTWWSEADKGGGILGAIGSHMIDALRWLLERPVVSVSAELRVVFPQRPDAEGRMHPVTSDEYASLRLTFAGGVGATLLLSTVSAGERESRITLAGSAGRLTCDGERLWGTSTRSRETEDLSPSGEPLPKGVEDREWSRSTYHLARALRRALVEGAAAKLDAATFDDGLAVQRVLDAARESSERGGTVVEIASIGQARGPAPTRGSGYLP